MTPNNLPEIYIIAALASIEASRAIIKIYSTDIKVDLKFDGSPVTFADLKSSEIVSRHLQKTDIPIVDEEMDETDFLTRSKWKENWCVDPLDGTKMFIQKNDEFAVNIAHVKDNKPVFGIIACPVEEKIIMGGIKHGVFTFSFDDINVPANWKSILPSVKPNNPLVVICSRSFNKSNQEEFEILRGNLGEVCYFKKGSALKFFDLAEGRADIYPRFAPTMEWDIAAGQAILEALGGEVVNIENNISLRYNKESLYNPFFIAKTKSLSLK